MNVAATVKPGGAIYMMLYDTQGPHNSPLVNHYRRVFSELRSMEDRLAFVAAVAERHWHRDIPLRVRIKNVVRNVLSRPKSNKIGTLDMMLPWFNWTVPIEVAIGWMKEAGFQSVKILNPKETGQSARHYLGTSKK